MEGPTCGFCHGGKSSELVCGPLFSSERCSAHYKCMQYSSCLVQYKSKEFGGFKVKKVLAEIGRGRRLSCFICKKKSTSKKAKVLSRGASAGCAHAACSRTFHFPCAAISDQILTKRIETVDNETQQTAVLYRIFCSKKHQSMYEKASEAEMEIVYNSCSSDSELGTDTESRTRNNDSQSDTSSSDESDADLPKESSRKTYKEVPQSSQTTSEKSSRPSNSKENFKGRRPGELKRPSSEGVKERVSVHLTGSEASDNKKQKGSFCQVELGAELEDSPSRSSLVSQDEESAQKEFCQDAVSRSEERYANKDKRVRCSGPRTRGQKGSSLVSTTGNQCYVRLPPWQAVHGAKKRNLIDADVSGGSSQSEDLFDCEPVGLVHRIRANRSTSDSKKQKVECRAKAAVCFMQDWQTREKLSCCAKLYVQNEFGIPESGVHLWHPGMHTFTYEHMLYFMNDVAKCITNCNTAELTELIFSFTPEHLEKYNQRIEPQKEYMDRELQNCINQKLWELTREHFMKKRDKLQVEVGGPVLLNKLQCIFLVVLLNEDIDPDGSITRRLDGKRRQQVHVVDPSTNFMKTSGIDVDVLKSLKRIELQTLKLWLTEMLGENPVYCIRPHEVIMRETSDASVTCLLCKALQDKLKGRLRKLTTEETTSTILFIVPVDPEMIAIRPYSQKLIPTFLQEKLPTLKSVFCILDVDTLDGFHSSKDIVPSLPPDVSLTVYSAFDANTCPISCLVLHFTTANVEKS